MAKTYAGIGSRRTPPDIQALMTRIAMRLAEEGWTLRSGHADGADWAFEQGAGTQAEIFLPWLTFNSHWQITGHKYGAPTQAAMDISADYHPIWSALNQAAKKLHARNAHQILGADLKSPVKFVICWTQDGNDSGGTGQALRLARAHRIPVFNLYRAEDRERLERFVSPLSPSSVSSSLS